MAIIRPQNPEDDRVVWIRVIISIAAVLIFVAVVYIRIYAHNAGGYRKCYNNFIISLRWSGLPNPSSSSNLEDKETTNQDEMRQDPLV